MLGVCHVYGTQSRTVPVQCYSLPATAAREPADWYALQEGMGFVQYSG